MLGFLILLGFLVVFVVPLVISIMRKQLIGVASGWFGIGLVLYIGLQIAETMYPDLLWYEEMGQTTVYWTVFWPKVAWFFVGGLVAALFMFANFLLTRMHLDEKLRKEDNVRISYLVTYIVGAVLSLIFAIASTMFWDQYLAYSQQVPFAGTDPVFGHNIAFYVFTLPYLNMIMNYGWILVILTMVGVAVNYIVHRAIFEDSGHRYGGFGSSELKQRKHAVINRLISHVSILGLFIVGLLIFTIKVWMWEFLFANHNSFSGAGYVDVTQRIGYYNFFIWILVISGILLLVSAFARSLRLTKWSAISAGSLALVYSIIFIGLIPSLNQHFSVSPNELSYETPYIERNIQATRVAYGLDSVEVKPFKVSDSPLTEELVNENRNTLDMIRLWDWTVLDANIQNNQSFRTYYRFPEPDVLRYHLKGKLSQVMASLRELDQEMIVATAQTWQNTKMVYTHGFGAVVVPVNGFDEKGDPTFLVKDIPPAGPHRELAITQPRIYFGEMEGSEVFVKTTHHEFDYPVGDTNATYIYEGTGGITLGSGMRSLLLALRYEGLRQLTATELTSSSRIMVRRNIMERVKELAPFLHFDSDPYAVIDQGRIWYIVDAYTVTDAYPYSKSFEFDGLGTLNYIRNSVKVTIDAYDGTVRFYIIDQTDPIIMTYAGIFPTLFTPISAMPASLIAHLRYGEDLFTVQSYAYALYHMQNVTTFYNREDLWDIATEEYHVEGVKQMSPYYAGIRLPGETTDEYVLMLPFTPHTTDTERPKFNMVSWLAGRCDAPNYGKLLVYEFPKDRIVQGPMQLDARINQHDVISKDLTLWNQQGSKVVKGNLIIVPLTGNRVLYVKPIFLQSINGRYPELKRVVVATNDDLAYAETFEAALRQLAGTSSFATEQKVAMPTDASSGDYVSVASAYFDEYIKLVGQGKLAEAGQVLEKLGVTLREAKKNKTD